MKLAKFLQESSNVYAENRLLKFVVVVIGLATLANTLAVIKAFNNQRTIIVPPVIRERIEVSGDFVDEKYIKEFTRYVMGLLLSYSPQTAKGQFEELLTLYAPEVYGDTKAEFYDMAESIKAARTSSVFYLNGIKVNAVERRIQVNGLLRQYIDDMMVLDAQRVYHLRYRITNGRFMLEKISEGVEGA